MLCFFACGRRWAGLDLCQGQAATLWSADLGLGLNPDNFLKWNLTFKYSLSTCGTMHIEKCVTPVIFEVFDDQIL